MYIYCLHRCEAAWTRKQDIGEGTNDEIKVLLQNGERAIQQSWQSGNLAILFKLHILLFYKAKSSILNIHGIQCYSYANIIVLFIC